MRKLALVLVGGSLLAGGVAHAAPNDNIANAIVITSPVTTGDNLGATLELGEPRPCGIIGSTVWFRFTPSMTKTHVLTTAGSSYDTVLAVYQGPPAFPGGSPIGCNDDTLNSLLYPAVATSDLELGLTAAVEYYIQVGGFAGAQGTIALTIA